RARAPPPDALADSRRPRAPSASPAGGPRAHASTTARALTPHAPGNPLHSEARSAASAQPRRALDRSTALRAKPAPSRASAGQVPPPTRPAPAPPLSLLAPSARAGRNGASSPRALSGLRADRQFSRQRAAVV